MSPLLWLDILDEELPNFVIVMAEFTVPDYLPDFFKVARSLARFTALFRDEDGLKDLASFVLWSHLFDAQRGIDLLSPRIRETILHDLAGIGSRGFCPRSSGYAGHLERDLAELEKKE